MALQARIVFVPFENGPLGLFLESPGNYWGLSLRAIFSSSVSKNGAVYAPETSCMRGNSVHIKNMRIKQLCDRKVRDFAMAFLGPEKIPRLSRKGPWSVTGRPSCRGFYPAT